MSKKKNGRKGSAIRTAARKKYEGGRQFDVKANNHYKDTVFRMLFREKRELLELYNAVSGRCYTDPKRLEIVTLEGAVYLGMKNDLAFLIDMNLYLFEHQSTVNRNMPFRFLQYVSAEYGKLTVSENLYGSKLIRIPAPHFMVFYNGTGKCAEREELKLSDAYLTGENSPELELRVEVLNINEGFNEELKGACRTLKEYMLYVEKVRGYAESSSIDEAVDKAVDECISHGILREFLLRNKAEVKRMSIFEYDEEAVRRVWKEEGYEEGYEEGEINGKRESRKEDILELLEEISLIPEELRKEIMEQEEEDTLKKWLKLAAKAESIEAFSVDIRQ